VCYRENTRDKWDINGFENVDKKPRTQFSLYGPTLSRPTTYIGDITRWREDMNFMFNISLFLPENIKLISLS